MNRSLKGICFTVAGGCCWGMSGVMGKYLFDAKDLTAMCQMTYFLAIQESNPGTATVIQYSAPILIMVFFVLVEKRFPKKEEVLGQAFGMIDVVGILCIVGAVTALTVLDA